MGHLRYLTMTGVRESTDFAQMRQLSAKFEFAEWQVDYSFERAGRVADYPSLKWLEQFAGRANKAGCNTVLSLCGASTRCLLEAANQRNSMQGGDAARRLFALAEKFRRVQLLVMPEADEVHAYRVLVQQLHRSERQTSVIFAARGRSLPFCEAIQASYGVESLLDRYSCGEDALVSRDRVHLRRPGYAGGLSLENLEQALPLLSQHAGDRPFWIVMGKSLRDTQDELDLNRCEAALETAQAFISDQNRAAGAVYGTGLRNVSQLEGLWLDWWVGRAQGRTDLVVPPPGAVRAMRVDRASGGYEGYEPTAHESHALRILSRERVALAPGEEGGWEGVSGKARCWGPTMVVAGLRTVVQKHFGAQVPANPYITT